MLPVTWGSAWMTVSNRALIPVAIFNSFNTKTLHVNISQIARASVYFCLTGRMHVCVCMPLVILRTLMMRMMVGLMGSEAFKSISSKVIPMMDNNTMARSSWFHLDKKKKQQKNPTHLLLHLLQCCLFVAVWKKTVNTFPWKIAEGQKRWVWELPRWQKPQ